MSQEPLWSGCYTAVIPHIFITFITAQVSRSSAPHVFDQKVDNRIMSLLTDTLSPARVRDLIDERFDDRPSWIVLIEMFIGLGWIRAATEKVIAGDWWDQTVIRTFVGQHEGLTIPWFRPVVDNIFLPGAGVLVILIPAGQLVAGLCILTARRLHQGIFIGMTMNLTFILIGAVDPSIFYLMLQAVLALWLFENRPITSLGVSYLKWIVGLAVVLTVASLPFIRTIDPAHVVEDPAMILVTYGLSIASAGLIALRRLHNMEHPAAS